MSRFSQSVISSQTPRRVFEVVNDIESYPEFVPWCTQAEILSRDQEGVTASLGFRVGLKTLRFTTRNTPRPYDQIHICLVEGPFRSLEGYWRFEPVGQGTRVSCEIEYEFASARMGALFRLFFPSLLGYLVSRFVDRAAS